MCNQNFEDFILFKNDFSQYVQDLKYPCGTPVLSTTRKLGFLICFDSLLFLYENLILNRLQFIPSYKINQDHVELFFGAIRSHQGHNNNPTARQFKAAYIKLLKTNLVEVTRN